MKRIAVSGSFDDLRSRHVRLLQEAAKLGDVEVRLWSDQLVQIKTGSVPKFPLAERRYLLDAIRYVAAVATVDIGDDLLGKPDMWAVDEVDADPRKEALASAQGIMYRIIQSTELAGFPLKEALMENETGRKKVMVTGCFDWLHSGHVRFFEEVAELGDLYVVVGHDDNVRLLKGQGHPLFPQEERRYMVQSIRFVKQALISTGHGWLDAEPEIVQIQPDRYAVNEDGDKPEKAAFCEEYGIEYVVLRRLPKEGLPRRESTIMRGF
jgi:cytidyltransferase-like protein